jgi:hypothetical protein
MESDDGFRSFSHAIESDPVAVLLAKWRRDAFIEKLKQLPDVADVIPSGSLARGTQIGPVHDVDLIVVFERSEHPDYGRGPESAQAAMEYLQNKLLEQLHPWAGAEPGLLPETELRRHVVKYDDGWAGPFADVIPTAPPVDVMPAVREGSHLLIPERGTGWIDADPEKFMRQVEQRQREWKYFTAVAGMVKAWARHNNLNMKNLAVDVMVLKYCPRPGLFETLSCGEAVARFFEAASKAHITSLKDPAGRCGEIDPSIDFGELRAALGRAAGLSRQAMDAEHAWKNRFHATEDVKHPDEFWRQLFGREYKGARIRFWRARPAEPWFGKYQVEFPVTADQGHRRTEGPGGSPGPPDDRGPNEPRDRGPDRPDRGPNGPDRGSPWPRRGPRPPFGGRRPSPGGTPGRPDGPGGGARRRPGPARAEPGTNLWTGVFGSAAVTVSVPLTFG